MTATWEDVFREWAKAPPPAEQQTSENAIRAIKAAVSNSPKLSQRQIKTFAQGSYRNRVNVRQDSDVDVGVLCFDVFLADYPQGMNRETFGDVDANYSFQKFKKDLEEALVAHFGRRSVHRGNKAFDLSNNAHLVEADVAPFFEYRQYWQNKTFAAGVALITDRGARIHNFPERLVEHWPAIPLHYEQGVRKNDRTSRRYKGVVRITKKLRNLMDKRAVPEAKPIPGFLIECLVWNAPDSCFDNSTWDARVQAVLAYLLTNTASSATCDKWCEVNGIKYLFHPSQRWTRQQAHAFVRRAGDFIGRRSA
ncbi:MAG: nucleotidyltransferase [Gemmatimonadetes bacterium]|nr:nucleotidyltransferase [Gemmatimonadota bacterium]MYG34467.1 nucleotidyltransferase [Gemmatimonadota bacterium]